MRTHFIPNPVRIDGDSAFLRLTNRDGVIIGEAVIDLEDLGRVLAAGRWYGQWNALAGAYYVRRNSGNPLMLHRLVMDAPSGVVVDHRDHNTLDCRKQNLRACTHAENMQNRDGAHKNSRSGVRGVYWDKKNQNWRAEVRANNQRTCVGSFSTMEEARDAVTAARKRLHGEFAA